MTEFVTSRYRRSGSTSHSLLSSDVEAMNEYRNKRKQLSEVQALRTEVESLRNELVELRAVVEKLTQRHLPESDVYPIINTA